MKRFPDEITQVNGQVYWSDLNNFFNTRPNDAVVSLFRNGTFVDKITVPASSDGKFSFKGLDAYDSNRRPYTYTFKQDNVPVGYNEAVENNIIKNELKIHNITVEFRNAFTGIKLMDDMICPVYYGSSLNITPPKVAGYADGIPGIYTFNKISGDNRATFWYIPK